MENERLVKRIKGGTDPVDNMLTLWQQMQGLIYVTAKKYAGYADFDDLLQESYIALYNAVSRFDIDAGVKFSTYATVCIKRHLYRYITKNHMTEHNTVSLYTPISDEYGETNLSDVIAGENNTEMEAIDSLQHTRIKEVLWTVVNSLTDKQQDILKMCYQQKMTIKEAGEVLGISQNEAANIKYRALMKLRHGKNGEKLKEFCYDSEIYSSALKGIGNVRFQQTWTSATERVALNL